MQVFIVDKLNINLDISYSLTAVPDVLHIY